MNKPRKHTRYGLCAIAAAAAIFIACAPATVEEGPLVHPLFSDRMVVQRDRETVVWGWSRPRSRVMVEIGGEAYHTRTGRDGRWRLTLPKMSAGATFDMNIESAGKRETLHNVAAGEVWLCAGQSNMDWPVRQSSTANEDIAQAKNPDLRLYFVPRSQSLTPQDTLAGNQKWKTASASSAPYFSAACYHFGQALQSALGVPVGLIQATQGGSPIRAWMRGAPQAPSALQTGRKHFEPASLYNAMISPLAPYALRGALWYQGESDTRAPDEYEHALSTMIGEWRDVFGQDLNFQIVQIANYGSPRVVSSNSRWARLRDAQRRVADDDKNASLIVTIDLGESDNIHPANKADVGKRAAMSALAHVYGRSTDLSPAYQRHDATATGLRITFDNVDGGLALSDGAKMKGFAWCPDNGKCRAADAVIAAPDTVLIDLDPEHHAGQLRYGWADNPVANLRDAGGLPAEPFSIRVDAD